MKKISAWVMITYEQSRACILIAVIGFHCYALVRSANELINYGLTVADLRFLFRWTCLTQLRKSWGQSPSGYTWACLHWPISGELYQFTIGNTKFCSSRLCGLMCKPRGQPAEEDERGWGTRTNPPMMCHGNISQSKTFFSILIFSEKI